MQNPPDEIACNLSISVVQGCSDALIRMFRRASYRYHRLASGSAHISLQQPGTPLHSIQEMDGEELSDSASDSSADIPQAHTGPLDVTVEVSGP